MARVNKNGNLSGAIGNLVFVNRDGKTHVRSKSKKVNQSTNIRGAATGFGKNSGHDRILRESITDKIQIRNYRCFSINHRTRLRLTIGESTNQDCTTKMAYLNPQPMVGTVFNNDWQWERATNFYPEYNLSGQNTMTVHLPQLTIGKQIIFPKNAVQANLNIYAFTINANTQNIQTEILSSLSFSLEKKKDIPAQDWIFDIPQGTFWIMILATISYTSPKNNIAEEHKHAGTYLWAKSINP